MGEDARAAGERLVEDRAFEMGGERYLELVRVPPELGGEVPLRVRVDAQDAPAAHREGDA